MVVVVIVVCAVPCCAVLCAIVSVDGRKEYALRRLPLETIDLRHQGVSSWSRSPKNQNIPKIREQHMGAGRAGAKARLGFVYYTVEGIEVPSVKLRNGQGTSAETAVTGNQWTGLESAMTSSFFF